MWRRYNYEVKQESHSFQEKRSGLVGYKNYYVPPPTIQKIDNHPPYHYDSSDVEEDDDDHHHHHVPAAVNNNHHSIHHDYDHGNRGNWYETHHASNHADVKNKQQGGKLLRPPIHHQYRHPNGVGHQGKEASWTKTNGRNHTMGDYPRKHFPNYYGEVLKVEDEYDNNEEREELEYPLMNGIMHGGNRGVKKIEVIEYERRTYRGGRQEWIVLGGNGAVYPSSHAPWVKRL